MYGQFIGILQPCRSSLGSTVAQRWVLMSAQGSHVNPGLGRKLHPDHSTQSGRSGYNKAGPLSIHRGCPCRIGISFSPLPSRHEYRNTWWPCHIWTSLLRRGVSRVSRRHVTIPAMAHITPECIPSNASINVVDIRVLLQNQGTCFYAHHVNETEILLLGV